MISPRIVQALILKDIRLFARDRFFALITVLALGAYVAVYLLMPSDVDETFEIAVYAGDTPPLVETFLASAAFEVKYLADDAAVRDAVDEGDYSAGLIVPEDFATQLDNDAASLTLVLPAAAPDERNDAISSLFQTLGYSLNDEPLRIQIEQEIIGQDRVGAQVPDRDRMIPLFAIFLLIAETMALASLIAVEMEGRTIRALLVSPTRLTDLFLAKGIVGVVLTFTQATAFIALTGSLDHQPLLILTTMLLGALLMTSIGFLLATVATSLLEIASWAILVFVIFSLPAISIMFPGTIASWVAYIPIYPLVDTVHQVANLDAGWGDVWQNLLSLLAISAAMLTASVLILERKLR